MTGYKLCLAIIFVVEAIIALLYFDALFERKRSRKVSLVSLLLGYSILYIISLVDNAVLNTGSFFVVNLLLIKACYFCKTSRAILHSAFLSFIMSAAEILMALLISTIAGDYAAFKYNLAVLISLAVSSKLLYLLIAMAVAHFLGPKDIAANEPSFLVLFCLQPIVSTVIALGIEYVGFTFDLTNVAEIFMTVGALSLMLLNIIVLVVYRHVQELNAEYTELQLGRMRDQSDAEYYAMLQKQYETQRILIHDIKNHLRVLDNLASVNGNTQISKYIGELQDSPALTHSIRFCSNPVLNIILLQYSNHCSEHQIRFECDVRSECISFMDDASLTALFGNLLSNAVEAADISQDRFVELFVKETEQKMAIISIINSCDIAPLTDAGGKYITKKNTNRHGFGTKSIERVIKRYDGMLKMYYVDSEKRFHSMIYFSRDLAG